MCILRKEVMAVCNAYQNLLLINLDLDKKRKKKNEEEGGDAVEEK